DTIFKNACFFNAKVNNVSLKNAYLYNDNINKKANDSAEKQASDSIEKQASDSIEKQASDSTDKQASDSIEKQANDSTDKQAKNSTEQQDSTSFNEARLKKEVNSSFSIPGLTSYQPTYIVEE
ncbi:TPA: type III effector, partial [Escherichia coli]|nr:type III effector [Escherichia coli]